MAYGDYIKVHVTLDPETDGVAGESLWGEDLSDNLAKIGSIPWFCGDKIGLHDIIEYKEQDGIREFEKIIDKKTNSWGITWEPSDRDDKDKILEEWKKIAQHMKDNDVHYESAIVGMFCVALPADTSDEDNIIWLKALSYSSPIPITPYFGEDEECEECD